MKVIAFNGSPKSNGNTAGSLKIVGEELIKEGIDFEIIDVGNKKIQGCIACGYCVREKNEKCVINDEVNEWIQKTKDADGLIFASPVYFAGIAGTMKCFLDRFFYVTGVNNRMLRHKVGVFVKRKVYQFSIEKYTIILKKINGFLAIPQFL